MPSKTLAKCLEIRFDAASRGAYPRPTSGSALEAHMIRELNRPTGADIATSTETAAPIDRYPSCDLAITVAYRTA